GEESEKFFRFLEPTHGLRDSLVVRRRILRRHDRIGPPRIHEQLAAAPFERRQIAFDRLHERKLLLGVREVAIPVDRRVVPVGVMEEKRSEEACPHRLAWIEDVLTPALNGPFAERLAAARKAREDRLTGPRTLRALVDFLDGDDLIGR